jgi:hypothetical protein
MEALVEPLAGLPERSRPDDGPLGGSKLKRIPVTLCRHRECILFSVQVVLAKQLSLSRDLDATTAVEKRGFLCPLCQAQGARRRSACAAVHLIDVQGRRQDEWTTVDPAVIRGLDTA